MATLAPCGVEEVFLVPLCSTKLDTLPGAPVISKQVFLYWTRGGTGHPLGGGSTTKNMSLADSSKTTSQLISHRIEDHNST
jgi:hypothetical protein